MDKSNYIFTTERLGFRRWKADDKEKFYHINSDPVVMKYFPSTLTREESDKVYEWLDKHFDDHGFGFYAVDTLQDNNFSDLLALNILDSRLILHLV